VRILTLTNGYPPHYYGGYELTCFDVMERFRQAGHDVKVLTSTARVPGVTAPDDAHVHRDLVPYWDWETNRRRQAWTPVGWWRTERRNLATLAEMLDAVRPDVVSVWHMIGLSMSLLNRLEEVALPLVVTVGNDWMVQAPDFDPWVRTWARWPFAAPASVGALPTGLRPLTRARMNFVSDFIKQLSIAEGRWPVPADSPVISPGIELRDFPITTPTERPWTARVIYVGRVDPVKGVDTLLRGFALLEATAQLDIIGGGPHTYLREMRQLADDLGVAERVRFGRCERHELRARYLAADVLVFPSEWDEPFGLVPLEAMACGVPVVATATGGAAEFLAHEGNCLTYPPGDAVALAAAVNRLAEDRDLVASLTARGSETAARFTSDGYARALLRLHEEAAA